jgi:drug/metabolite transporter (DMT)-like permease
MTPQKKSYLLAITAVAFWSTIATAFKITLRHIGFVELLFFASLTSTVVFAVYLSFSGRLAGVFRHPPRRLLAMAFAGILNPFLYYLILLRAYELLPAQEAGTLNYAWPVVLVLLSVPLLGQKIGWSGILSVFISFTGILLISTHGDLTGFRFSNPVGVALALTCPFVWALYWIINMKIPGADVEKLFVGFLTGTLLIGITHSITGKWSVPSLPGLAGALYAGFFEMGITFILWLKALKLSKTTAHISNLVFLSPFLSLFYIHLFVGESILPSTIAGLFLVVGGILFGQYAPVEKIFRK